MFVTNNPNLSIRVFLKSNLVEIFNKYKQDTVSLPESCGILIGTHSVEETRIRVTCITEPDHLDERKRYFFKIKSKIHSKILQKRFKQSEFHEVYLGTWHTHPEESPTPSDCDLKDWAKQYSINKHLFDIMIFVIIGTKTNRWWGIKNGVISEISESNIFIEKNEEI